MVRKILFYAVSLLVQGCSLSTPYQPKDGVHAVGGGYEDRKIDENTFWVSFEGNSWTSPEQVLAFWLQRGKELCHGPPKDIKTGRADNIRMPAGGVGNLFTEGTFVCQ